MVKDVLFVSIRLVVDRLLRHPLLQSLDLELATLYTVDFLHLLGLEDFYEDKEEVVQIKDYRGELPCDLLLVIQVKDNLNGISMRSTTNVFKPAERRGCNTYDTHFDATYKTQNRVIFTSFRDGEITVAYKAIAVDEEGYPMVIDNSTFLKALELYIKQELFTILFDLGKINGPILLNTQLEYCWYVGKCESEFTIPSISEMESLNRSWNTLVDRTTEFDNGWKTLGKREYLRRH